MSTEDKKIMRIQSLSQVHEMLGLEKPKHPLITLIPIDASVTNYDYGDFTYVFDFYQIALKSGIKGSFKYGRSHYDFQEGSMIFTKPGQAQSYTDDKELEGEQGWVLLFHPDLIRRSTLGQQIDQYTFFSYESNEALHLSDEEKRSITELVEKIKQEYEQNIDKHTQKLIVSNLELILDYCTRYYDRQFYVRTNHNQDLVSKLEVSLREYFESGEALENGLPTVSHFATLMNMSAHYLSDLLKKEIGMNAQQYIQGFMIDRAKNMLLGTDEQVSQIAYALGFEYPQHFSKLFKTKTGMSPKEYRSVQ